MKLYLIRHGEALPSEMDPQRPLSAQGQTRVHQLAQRLAEKNTQVSRIFHSGILRARQTAEIIAQSVGLSIIEQIDGLNPDDPVEPMVAALGDIKPNIMLVGHLPFMANLLWALCSSGWSLQFDTAMAVCLERTDGHWVIDSVIRPEDLRLV